MIPKRGWLSRNDAAAALDVSVQQFDRKYAPLAGQDGQQKIDGRLYFRIRSIIDGLLAEKSTDPAATDPLLTGGPDSPALERYRTARAESAEIDVSERKRETVTFALLWPVLERFSGLIRRGGETLQHRFGTDAATVFNDALDEAERVIRTERERENG